MSTFALNRRFRVALFPLVLLWLSVAAGPAAEIAGEDASQGGFGRSAPVVAALEKYHHDQGRYPARERELVPRYLPDNRTYGTYRRLKDGSYALTFGYTRGSLPGLTVWTYYSTTRRWVHSGYY